MEPESDASMEYEPMEYEQTSSPPPTLDISELTSAAGPNYYFYEDHNGDVYEMRDRYLGDVWYRDHYDDDSIARDVYRTLIPVEIRFVAALIISYLG